MLSTATTTKYDGSPDADVISVPTLLDHLVIQLPISSMASIIGSAAHAAHSAAVALTSVSPIKVGGMLPHVTVKEDDPEKSLMIASTGKIVIVGLPAAFSPPCNSQVPGYIEHYDKLKAKGVSEVYIVAVNDAFVTK